MNGSNSSQTNDIETRQQVKHSVGDRLSVSIVKIVPRGLGLGFADGLTVFVPLAAPGDTLAVAIKELKKRIAYAEIVSVDVPSAFRIEPPCKYFGECGGCDMQQLDYASQLAAKVGIIEDSLRRIGKFETVPAIGVVGSPAEFHYRSRAGWHVDSRKKLFGYFRRGSHDVIDIEECPILVPALNTTLKNARQDIEWEMMWKDVGLVEAAAGDTGAVSLRSDALPQSSEVIESAAAGFRYRYSAETFFQGNRSNLAALISAATDALKGETALDLYCGVGLFSMPLARSFTKVIGIEGNTAAIEFANQNAQINKLENLEFHASPVGRYLRETGFKKLDAVLLDPPRTGPEPGVIDKMIKIRPRNVSYVSCDPAILARDLRQLLDGGYEIEKLTAIDLFPQTHHIETVARLRLKA